MASEHEPTPICYAIGSEWRPYEHPRTAGHIGQKRSKRLNIQKEHTMRYRVLAVSALGASLALSMAACSSSGSSAAAGGSSASASPTMAASAAGSPAAAGAASTMDFGPACSAVPTSGAGSFSGMATAPVATAASANPVLSTLVAAVKKAGLVDTLNSAQNITVFAPDNAAFAKIPAATLDKVLDNKAELTKILTYHVASGRYTPTQLASGTAIKTLEGSTVTPALANGTYTVNDANVVCGNVQTANATVYIIDTVLMPPSS
jgi:uncharacterized surface protein with fasciclin (FAS1) repeats